MRICIITEYFATKEGAATGGVEARAFHIGKRLAQRHDVTLITSWKKGMARRETIEKMRVIRVGGNHPYTNAGAVFPRLRFACAAYRAARALAAQKKPDVIEGANFISYLPAAYAAKKTGARAVATYHEVWLGSWIKNKGVFTGMLGALWERCVLRQPWSAVISVSEYTKKKLEQHGIRNIRVIPNGISDVKKERNKEIKKEKDARYQQPTVCYIGRLTPQKRVIDLLDAIALLQHDKKMSPRCIIVGDGPEKEKLERHAQQCRLKNVEFLGFVKEQEKVRELMQKSHILCHPSILEGFGMVLIEAAACGTPYVCSDIEVFREVTKNGKGGLLFQQKNVADCAEKIRTMLAGKKLHAQKAREAVALAQEYRWDTLAGQVEKAYETVRKPE